MKIQAALKEAVLTEEDFSMVSSSLRLVGLDCADCAAKLENKINQLAGVKSAQVNFGASKLTVMHEVSLDKIIRLIEESGYGVQSEEISNPEGREKEYSKSRREFWQKNKKTMMTVISGFFVGSGFLFSLLGISETYIIPLYLMAMVTGGFYVARSGLYSLKNLSLDMNFLMTVAAVGAVAIGEWHEGATVVFLFSLGNTLQAYTMDKTRNSIRALMDLSPKEALVQRQGKEVLLPLKEIVKGDIIIVKPGQRIAMDGRVIAGTSGVNQAPITGESMPVEKRPGDEVFAGTINEQGSLEIEVTKLVADTTLAKIIQLVEEAQAQKAPSQQFVDVFAKYYTPLVILTAVVVAVAPTLFFGAPFTPWFKKALILLVISCPCALVISTPVAIVASIGNAARNGVLIKGGAYLEATGALKAIAFDKTGTLTKGRPEVTEVISLGQKTVQEVTAVAAAIERRSQHPLAEAVIKYADWEGCGNTFGEDFLSIAGKGASAKIGGELYYIGNPRLFEDLSVDIDAVKNDIARLQNDGKTVMLVGDEKEVYGLVAVADVVRDSSADTIRKLKSAGIGEVIMLTGDNEGTARAISETIGVDRFQAELLPEDKLSAVRGLVKRYGSVGMVGDGINDAPALAAATVGIAMGGAGTDSALETADIALMADDLSKLPYAIKLSRQALQVIKQNIGFSLVVKGAFLILTFMGMANLWMAVFADTGAALLVIANGMRLFKVAD